MLKFWIGTKLNGNDDTTKLARAVLSRNFASF